MRDRDTYWRDLLAQLALVGLLALPIAYACGYIGGSLPQAGFA